MSNKVTKADLLARIAQLETELAACRGGALTAIRTDSGQTRYNVAGLKKDGLNYTPSAVDAIRLYTWPRFISGVAKKDIIASLISQGFTKATVQARVKRIFDGTDESCHSEAIRGRLGLDELEDELAEDAGEE